MERFCDELRAERERRGVSLGRIGEITKFSQRHLRALEAGDYASLPGGIFRKGLLRGYLSALGLEDPGWLSRFEQSLAEQGQGTAPVVDLLQIAEGVQRSRGQRMREPTRWPGVCVMVALLMVFGWCVWRFALRGHVVLSATIAARAIESRSR